MNSISGWAIDGRISGLPCFAASVPSLSHRTVWPAAAQESLLQEIGALKEDWDGYGAAVISPAAIQHARWLLRNLADPPTFIAPSSAGTINFEWESPFGTANLEIGDDTFGFYTAPKVGKPIMLSGAVDEVSNALRITSAVGGILEKALAHSLALCA